jgi:hypothetical protein
LDLTIKRNENCIVGTPRCDYVFNSQRACFIGYGFNQSSLEMEILRSILTEKGIEALDAGTEIKPGQNAFCLKICSKILTSQFCIILANNDIKKRKEIPNANVNMEYGLMLGFNKYVIPFQREEQQLPFNIAALDTIKYNNRNFKERAEKVIDMAIKATQSNSVDNALTNMTVDTFLASYDMFFSPIDNEGEKAFYQLGSHLGFNLLSHFDGLQYVFFGLFTNHRIEIIIWKVKILIKLLKVRSASIPERVKIGLANEVQGKAIEEIFNKIKVWLLVQTGEDRTAIDAFLKNERIQIVSKIITQQEVRNELDSISENIVIQK